MIMITMVIMMITMVAASTVRVGPGIPAPAPRLPVFAMAAKG